MEQLIEKIALIYKFIYNYIVCFKQWLGFGNCHYLLKGVVTMFNSIDKTFKIHVK